MIGDATKVLLSAGELSLMADKDIILTKRALIETVAQLLAQQINEISELFNPLLQQSAEFNFSPPKISRGENYLGFPYLMLDHPAHFEKHHIFALRTMFWWGNYMSIHLHVSGRYKLIFEERIQQKLQINHNLLIQISEAEWQHKIDNNTHLPAGKIKAANWESILLRPFLKVSVKYELHQFNMMQSLLSEGYKNIADLLLP